MKKKLTSGIIVLIVIFTIVLLTVAVSLNSGQKNNDNVSVQNPYGNPNGVSTSRKSTSEKSRKNKKYIAAVYVEGTMENANNYYNQKWLLSNINELKNDSNNLGIALYINSPGGGVYQADEVYLALQDYKTKGKKIYVYMGPTAASGGYYISCAADKIYANRNTITGSIGVIMGQVFDLTELMDNLGIKSTSIASGKNKNLGNFNEPFRDDQKELMQAICDECYEQFLSIVVTQRKLDYKKARELADGRVFTAKQALDNGLIDAIDSWENMMEDLSLLVSDSIVCKIKVYSYQKEKTLLESFWSSFSKNSNPEVCQELSLQKLLYKTIYGKDYSDFNSYPAYMWLK